MFSFSQRLGKKAIIQQWEENKLDYFVIDLVLNKKTYGLYAYEIDSNDERIFEIKRQEWKLICDLVRFINHDEQKISNFLRGQLDKAFLGALNKGKQLFDCESFSYPLTNEIINSKTSILCKNSIREILDDSFDSFSQNSLIYNQKFNFATFFSVIRYPFIRGNLSYTAQILLSGNQKKAIELQLNSKKGRLPNGFSINSFEEPLEGSSTSLADRCFALDTVQFGLPYDSKNQNEKTQKDTARRLLEDSFYKKLFDNKPPQNVFYVPIHVNGTAWIAIYRVLPKDSKFDNWFLNFEMYNQYTLLIAEKIRLKAKEKFYKLIYFLIEKSAFNSKDTRQFFLECGEQMKILSAFYPYPIPFFTSSGLERSLDDYLLSLDESCFNLGINSLWTSSIEYDKIALDDLKKHISFVSRQVGKTIRNKKIEEELIDASYSISHLLKNKLDEPIGQVNEMVNNLNNLVDDKGLKLDKSEYQNNYQEFNTLSDDLRDTLSILDLIPKSTFALNEVHDYRAFLNKKYKFLLAENENLNLIPVIDDAANRKKVKTLSRLSICIIEPFIVDEDNKRYSPQKLLYHNCFVEAIINYKEIPHVGELIITKCLDSNGTVGIGFKNIIKSENQLHSEFIEVNRDEGFHGAIGYLNTVLKKVGIGIIKKRVIIEADNKYFEVGMFFNNLKLQEDE